MFVVVGGISKASAASCSITSTLRQGSKGAQVVCLQTALGGLKADGDFGAKTKAAVIAWQKNSGLTADGVFGPKSNAVWMNNAGNSTNFPAGCASNSGFSPITGQSCASGQVTSMTYPAGCTSASGYSPTTGASCATGVVVQQMGTVTAMLASDTPLPGYIIKNQATADLAHFAFSGNGTINSVTLHRSGISSQNTLANVYLYNGSTRITDGFSFNMNGDLVMSNLGLMVNGTLTISVKADVADDTASSLAIALTSFTNGTTVNTVNIQGNTMTYSTGSLATASLSAQTVASPTVNAGTSSFTLWSAPMQVNTRTEWLKGINFRVTGSAPSDAVQNAHLFVDGVDTGKIATMGSITGSTYAMFDFSAMPVSLTTGSHTIDLRADVVKGSSYNLIVSIQQASDIVLYDPQVGANIAVTGTPNTTGTITIATGTASTNVDPTFQTLSNITGGTTNAVIGKFKVHGYGEDVKVSTLSVTPILTGMTVGSSVSVATTEAGLNNVTLYFNGSQVCSATGASSWTTSAALSFNCGSQMILPAGTDSYIEVHADLQNAATGTGTSTHAPNQNYTGGVVSVKLNGGSTNASGQTSKANIGFPAGDVTTSGLTVSTGTLVLSKNANYSNQTVGPNTVGAKIGSFTLQNQSTTEAVRVTNLKVSLALTTANSSNYTNLTTSDATTGPINPATVTAPGTSDNNFSVNFQIAPNSTHTVDVFADTGAATSGTVIVSLIPTTFGVTSNTNVTPGTKAAQTITLGTSSIANSGAVSLLTASSTSAQYVPTANGGVTDASKATFKILATGGSATISEMKISVNSQLEGATAGTAASAGTLTSLGSAAITITADSRFAMGDYVKICAGGTYPVCTTPAYGYVISNSTVTLTVMITTVGSGTPSHVDIIPGTVTAIRIGSVTTPVVNGLAYIQGLSLQVPNGGAGLSQDVYVSYGEVSTSGLPSGATARIAIESIKYSSGGGTPTTLCTAAVGTCSPAGNVLAAGITAPTMILVGSSPTVTVSTPSGVVLQASTNVEAIDVTVTAGSKGPITVNSFPISTSQSIGTGGTFTFQTGTGNPFTVKDANGSPITVDNTSNFSAATGGAATITLTGGYPLNAGQSVTFRVFLPVNALVAGSTALPNIYANTHLATGTGFTWTDTAGGASAANNQDVTVTTTTGTAISGMYNYPSTTTASIHN